ncbi:ABC transporter ATP-binding protein [Georgenia deserti]|uniref:ABC transporter ATP-binding protein n=1 Tax=Georgenia deserti TaxID=2093781 RepID=A0ABW4L4R5_9MICO
MSSPAADPALSVTDLRKSYGTRPAVRGVGFTAERGVLTAVLGPNGAGKTTTVECCAGLRRADAGTIEVLGRAVVSGARSAGYPAELRARVGVMLQDGGLPQAPKAGAVLEHVARLHHAPADPSQLLDRLGLRTVARTSVRRLSGGQRQRLALAAALVGRPELVFLDEPSAGLDPQVRLDVWELLRELRDAGVSMVLTTHLMQEAEELADHVVIIDDGRVVARGSPGELTGPEVVRVLPRQADDVAAVAAVLRHGLAGHDRFAVSAHSTEVTVQSAQPPDAAIVAAVGTALAEAGYGDAQIRADRRTLEDVFLELTGRRLGGPQTALAPEEPQRREPA